MRYGFMGLLVMLLAGCTGQQPAPVVSGYKGGQVEVARPVVRENVRVSSGLQERAAAPLVREEAIEPAAGPDVRRRTVVAMPTPRSVQTVEEKHEIVEHTVLPTDTVYKLARQYRSSADAIMKENQIDATSIRPGMVLRVPVGAKVRVSILDDIKQTLSGKNEEKQNVAVEVVEPAAGVAVEPQAMPMAHETMRYSLSRKAYVTDNSVKNTPVEVVEPAAGPGGGATKKLSTPATAGGSETPKYLNHRVEKGETIYRISRQYGVSVLDIMAANVFEKPQELKFGMLVRVPLVEGGQRVANGGATGGLEVAPVTAEHGAKAAGDAKTAEVVKEPMAAAVVEATPVKEVADDAAGLMQKAELKRGQIDKVAARAEGPVWPLKGKIVRSFGQSDGGVAPESGVTIAVPMGTPVLATDKGSVLYADDGLKTYGKMVLIRHSNGMVSAYANNGHLLVRKGDSVKKGQVIAVSGNSGNAEQPQLHFEIRQHARAVDPVGILGSL